jgi:hypothetical protein
VEVIKTKTMKTNYKQPYSYASTFMPLLRYVTTRNLAIAMFVALALLGTMHGNETEKMAIAKGSAKAAELSQGSLVVYSVMDRFDDDDVVYYEYSSYAIYSINGKLFRHVENRVSSSDQIPKAVTLPAGSYVIEARSATNVYVRVPVVIKAGRQTILDLGSRGKESFSEIVRN